MISAKFAVLVVLNMEIVSLINIFVFDTGKVTETLIIIFVPKPDTQCKGLEHLKNCQDDILWIILMSTKFWVKM